MTNMGLILELLEICEYLVETGNVQKQLSYEEYVSKIVGWNWNDKFEWMDTDSEESENENFD